MFTYIQPEVGNIHINTLEHSVQLPAPLSAGQCFPVLCDGGVHALIGRLRHELNNNTNSNKNNKQGKW